MDKKLTVFMVEDDNEECIELMQHIDEAPEFRLVGVTNNENNALKSVQDHLPDVIILDLELYKGRGNGIGFLKALRNMQLKPSPFILVTTHNISHITHEIARQLGADFIMVKSREDYCAGYVVEFLISLKNTIQDMQKKIKEKTDPIEETPANKKKRQEVRIVVEIDRIGISPKAIGRSYLINAILNRIEGKQNHFITIAEKYGKTAASVERAMQNAINRAWSVTNSEDLRLYYTSRIHSDKGVPTVTEFICYYADKVKAEY
ncbi:MAG: response regulator [Oscillospiraceae bacterium]|nr:response regulator [Oscillospiraceae bacterium]